MHFVAGHLEAGFRIAPQQVVLVSAAELFQRQDLARTTRRRQARAIDSFLELRQGDLVVHLAHGIGRYRGLRLLEKDGLLYLSVFIPMAELHRELPEGEWYEDHRTKLPDGRTAAVHTRHHLDRRNRVLQREHRYELLSADDSIEAEHLSSQTLRWFTPRQLRGLLEKSGFEAVHALADFDPELPVDDEAQIVTVVARRTGD